MTDKDKLDVAMKALNWIISQRQTCSSDPVEGFLLQEHAKKAVDIINGVSLKRKRIPRDMSKKRWPPDMDQEAIEKAIDTHCGCAGGWDCDCVSVFNQVGIQEWTRYNTRAE